MVIEGEYDKKDWYGVVRVDGAPLDPKHSQEVFNHSPDGFAWGYGGSGPTQLALAILLAAKIPERKAVALHSEFCRQVIATLPKASSFKILVDVQNWVRLNG